MNYYNPIPSQFSIKDIKITSAFISIYSLNEKLKLNEINVHPNNFSPRSQTVRGKIQLTKNISNYIFR